MPLDFFFKTLFFRAILSSQQNWPQVQTFPKCPLLPFPVVSIQDGSGTFVTIHEATLVHLYHPKSIVCSPGAFLVVACILGFGPMRSDVCTSHHTEYFHCPKRLLCPACSSLPFHTPWQPLTLLLSP